MPETQELHTASSECLAPERFDIASNASVLPMSADMANRTVDVVWYGGATVDRTNRKTGDPYKLRLDMKGAKLDRLNNGGAIFDNHMTGEDFPSMMAGNVGTKAQIGVVRKAWADGSRGMATLQFAKGDRLADDTWSKISQGVIQNLSFGAWISNMSPDESFGPNGFSPGATPDDDEAQEGPQHFVATDWEPFEISPVCVPADFSTCFLSAETSPTPQNDMPAPQQPAVTRASAHKEQPVMPTETTQAAGAESGIINEPVVAASAPPDEAATTTLNLSQGFPHTAGPVFFYQTLPSVSPMNTNQPIAPVPVDNTEALRAAAADATRIERERSTSIRLAAKPFAAQLAAGFVDGLVTEGLSVDASRNRILDHLAANSSAVTTQSEVTITRDQSETRRENMEAALLFRHDRMAYQDLAAKGRDYIGMSLLDMARECLQAAGVNTRGLPKQEIAKLAIQGPFVQAAESFAHSAGSTSDFPAILANVANKSLRKAYDTYPSTFKPIARQVTAADFKPLNRVQLSDVSALPLLNEDGEYTHVLPTDTKETYSIATYGQIISITRKVIINDDLQAFTRVPMLLGVAAARLEADKVWALFTGNPNMADGNAIFSSAHANYITGTSGVLSLTSLATAKKTMRTQTAPKGTLLNLVPKYLVIPAALENTADQLVSPMNIASSDFSKVVPQWVRSLQPIVEPRLDATSATAWYLVADPAMIDTIEYCYLEGQEGIYTETRQGFNVDGVEVKARLDFGTAAIEFRGLQQTTGVA